MSHIPQDSVSSFGFRYRRGLHTLAVVTACAVFPLVLVGASVTSKDVGMAYSDGFTSDGYLIRNPPGWWDQDDTRWEHGHRLLGRAVGLLSIALAIGCWRCGGTIRVLGVCNLLAIITQGTLGAFRVYEVSRVLAMIHGIFGQMCFCLTCSVALVTGRTWLEQRGMHAVRAVAFLRRLCVVGAGCVLVQLATGAAVRHLGLDVALFLHVFGAVIVTFVTGWIAMWIMGQRPGRHLLTRFGRVLAGLMVIQLLLGGAAFAVTVMGISLASAWQWIIPSAHVGVGALLFACLVLVTLYTYGILRPAPESTPAATAGMLSTA